MKLSTRSTYGVRAMYDLALHRDAGPTSVVSIAKREGISKQYLEHLLNRLKKNGLVRSVRGPKGGYVLAKNPAKITVGDIIRNLEGSIGPVSCFNTNGSGHCKKVGSCSTKLLWEHLKESIDTVLDTTTLKDIVFQNGKHGILKKAV